MSQPAHGTPGAGMSQATAKTPRLVGGIHRDISGRIDEPLRFYLTIDRGLKSGQLETVPLDGRQILNLISEGARALVMLSEEGQA